MMKILDITLGMCSTFRFYILKLNVKKTRLQISIRQSCQMISLMIMDCPTIVGEKFLLHITCSNILIEGIKKGSHVKQKNRSMSTRPTGGQMQ